MEKHAAHKEVAVIFAEHAVDRDSLRNSISTKYQKIFCFEKEPTCFDNLETIKPEVIILKTDSESVLWRFIFAAKALKTRVCFLVASDKLDIETLVQEERDFLPNVWIKSFKTIEELFHEIEQFRHVKGVEQLNGNHNGELLVGRSKAIMYIKSLLPTLINTKDPILISGEQGVGKERLIRQILSGLGKDLVCIKLNCSEIRTLNVIKNGIESNLDSEIEDCIDLIQYEINRPIVFYLDRINRLKDKSQLKILLFIDEVTKHEQIGQFPGNSKVRFISTSDRDLGAMVISGTFRNDLYHRLNVIPLYISPLRERKEDIPLLVDYFLISTCSQNRKSLLKVSPETINSFFCYDWPHNMDELRNIIERIVQTRNESEIVRNSRLPKINKKNCNLFLHSLNKEAIPNRLEIKSSISSMQNLSLKNICDKFASKTEKRLMQKALESTNWNRKKAAALLNISYKSMLNKIKIYEIA